LNNILQYNDLTMQYDEQYNDVTMQYDEQYYLYEYYYRIIYLIDIYPR
jgi:hypothetical protein